MSNTTNALNAAKESLLALQKEACASFPVGTKIKSRRGRGEASFEVVGFPEPTSLELANSVLGRSKNAKVQILNLTCVSLDVEPEAVA